MHSPAVLGKHINGGFRQTCTRGLLVFQQHAAAWEPRLVHACDQRERAQADTDEGQEACDRLGVEVLPTLQFWRDGAKLWEHRGVVELDQDLAEGALPGRMCLLQINFQGLV